MEKAGPTVNPSQQRVLEGWLTDLPPEGSTTVRVFFSSTFTDMTVERNLLMKEAVPYLRDYCKERGLDYQVVDMRWGVREDASVEHTTTEVCLQEIVNCQQDSAGPCFVAFLGDRYGNRLLPTTIPVTEYRCLRRLASWMDQSDFAVVDKWYLVDTNAVPAVYRIQPITALCPHFNDPDPKNRIIKQQHQQTWNRDQAKMLNVLRVVSAEAYERKMISSEEYTKYYISVTHCEVKAGMVNSPDVDTMNVNKVLSFHRTLNDINIEDVLAKRFIDLTDEGEIDKAASELRSQLKDDIVPSHLDDSCISSHTINWTDKGVDRHDPDHAAYLKTFCETFTVKMMHMIDKCSQNRDGMHLVNPRTELYKELLVHLRFGQEKCRHFCGREDELHKIQNLLDKIQTPSQDIKEEMDVVEENIEDLKENKNEDGESNEMQRLLDMCKITGATFSYGDSFNDYESDPTRDIQEEHITMPRIEKFKRPIIIHGMSGSGKTALMAKITQLSKRWVSGSVCVVRFMGTTAMSSNIRDVLVSVIFQLLQLYNLSAPTGLDLHADFHYLTQYFNTLLWRINSKTKPLFLLLDSVDQLQSTDYAHLFTWLPKVVPPSVRMIVSMATDHPTCLSNVQEQFPYEGQFIQLGSLDKGAADKVVRSVCHQSGRTLTAAQRSLVLQTFEQSGQPLHLKLITDQSLSWRSHYKMSALTLADTVEGAIEQLFVQLEKTHGEVLVSRTLAYLTLAKDGLSDTEMEDILSLDDEVLQDTYIFHLPPDPHVIRLPSSLLVRIKNEIAAYLSKQVTGWGEVSTWYHRHFREAALRRYATEDVCAGLHRAMADYFMGTWSTRPKPLELFKGKKGTYENCLRGVPSQPIAFEGFGKPMANVRKLLELPHHLAQSDSWDDFHIHVACSVQWMVAICRSLGVTTLLSQFTAMLSRGRIDEMEDEQMKQKAKDILFVKTMINLGVDDIRRNPLYVPVQILGQLGPKYKGSAAVEGLVHQCQEYLATSDQALFIPQNAFMPAPGGLLLSSINLRLFIMGTERVCGQSVCVDEVKQFLYVVEWSPNNQPDSVLVLDYENYGITISREKLPFFIHSLHLVAGNRFFQLKVYDKLSKHNATFSYMLMEGNLSTPYIFDKPVAALSVASHGHLVAYAFKDDKMVNMGSPDSKHRKVQVKQHMYMEHPIAVLLFSPDASELVAVDSVGNISSYNTTLRQVISLHTNTDRMYGFNAPTPEQFHITRSRLLLRVVHEAQLCYALSVLDLVTRREKYRLTCDKLNYNLNIIELDEKEEFVMVCTTESAIVNGITDRPAVMWQLTNGQLTTIINSKNEWQSVRLIGDETLFCLASCSYVGMLQILSCGPRESPLAEAQLLCELTDHSKSIFTLQTIQNNKFLVSAAKDNTLKFWDLARILKEKHVPEEDPRQLLLQRKKKQKKEVVEEKTGMDLFGKTTAIAVTGMDDSMVYFGTGKGVVAYSKLDNSDDICDQPVIVTSDLPPVHLIVLSRKGDYLMVAAKNIVAVFDARQAKLLYTVPGLKGEQAISCIAEGGYTAALGHGGMEGKVKLWDLKTGDLIKTLSFLYCFHFTAVNRSGTQVVASMFEYPIVMNIYGTENESMAGGSNLKMDKLDTMMTSLTFVCISPSDNLVAACDGNGITRVVSTENQYLYRLQQRSTPTYAVFTMDSQLLLTTGYRSIYVWNMASGQFEFKLTRHQDFVTSLRFALDDRFLISSSLDRSIAVWDFRSRATVCVLQAQCQLHSMHLLPDLSRVVYTPGNVANLAVVKPNPTLQKILENGRCLADLSDPETLEQASAFATSFTTQKDTSKTTSVACSIL